MTQFDLSYNIGRNCATLKIFLLLLWLSPYSFFQKCLLCDLLQIVYTSLLSGYFSEALKTAVIKPLLIKNKQLFWCFPVRISSRTKTALVKVLNDLHLHSGKVSVLLLLLDLLWAHNILLDSNPISRTGSYIVSIGNYTSDRTKMTRSSPRLHSWASSDQHAPTSADYKKQLNVLP